ncbi:MAG: 50S ribosomal protein L1 [Chlamydiia bacterium]|nr:50S ribosomal protein L1 [Chlamydiia bacterium]
MTKRSKRYKEIQKLVDKDKSYGLGEAVEVLKSSPSAKFDESVEIALRLGVDPKKSDQQVRSTVFLPHGTGKTLRVVVLAKGDKAKEALEAGADEAGDVELLDKIKGGWTGFDALIATPDMMREVGKLGKVLGPRGLMPTPKAGTVTTDVKKGVEDLKKGKIEFKVDKNGVINNFVGKLSFSKEQVVENIESLLSAISKMKPATAKGQFLRSLFVSSTMGAGLKIDLNSLSLS